jgi:hypothetical protein
MGTIKERAAEYAHKYRREVRDLSGEMADVALAGFIAGAKSERKEMLQWDYQSEANDIIDSKEFRSAWGAFVKYLFKWHDPKEELPETDVEVLVKIDAPHNKYDIMKHNQHGWWQKAPGGGWCAPKYKPIGWRHIHEL